MEIPSAAKGLNSVVGKELKLELDIAGLAVAVWPGEAVTDLKLEVGGLNADVVITGLNTEVGRGTYCEGAEVEGGRCVE